MTIVEAINKDDDILGPIAATLNECVNLAKEFVIATIDLDSKQVPIKVSSTLFCKKIN
jgi:hypothetical protein